jgi:nucleotide-binding universal stress UspA family protein
MFKKILTPLDLTSRHGPALERAVELAQLSKGEVILVHVIELISGLSQAEEPDFYKRLERKTRKSLEDLGATLTSAGVSWKLQILYGNPAQETTRFAAEEGADLILLTAPRFDPDPEASVWGSLSWKIAFLSRCPVLLVK